MKVEATRQRDQVLWQHILRAATSDSALAAGMLSQDPDTWCACLMQHDADSSRCLKRALMQTAPAALSVP